MKRAIIFILSMLLCMGFCFGCGSEAEVENETEPTVIVEETMAQEEILEESAGSVVEVETIEVSTKPVENISKPSNSSNTKPNTTKPTTPKTEETAPTTPTPTEPTPEEPTKPAEPEETLPPEKEETIQSSTVYMGRYKLTAYCNCSKCCGQWAGGPTATGTMPKQGRTIAVDPKVIPYGSKVIINGHTYIAEDCGGGIKGNRIDVYMDSHSAALQFGVQYADVYVVK